MSFGMSTQGWRNGRFRPGTDITEKEKETPARGRGQGTYHLLFAIETVYQSLSIEFRKID